MRCRRRTAKKWKGFAEGEGQFYFWLFSALGIGWDEWGEMRADRKHFYESAAAKWWENATTDDDELDPAFLGAV